jgi:hypothetical protein
LTFFWITSKTVFGVSVGGLAGVGDGRRTECTSERAAINATASMAVAPSFPARRLGSAGRVAKWRAINVISTQSPSAGQASPFGALL